MAYIVIVCMVEYLGAAMPQLPRPPDDCGNDAAYIVVACIGMAYIVMTYIVMVYRVMAYTVMAHYSYGRLPGLPDDCGDDAAVQRDGDVEAGFASRAGILLGHIHQPGHNYIGHNYTGHNYIAGILLGHVYQPSPI